MIVLKFGGKSLGDKQKICKIARYLKSRCKEDKLLVVVSAIADTTDKLIELAQGYCKNPDRRELDALLSCGEAVSASLMAMKLCSLGVKAVSLLGWQAGIFAEGDYNKSVIVGIDKSYIEKKMKSQDCLIIAGFQGVNSNYDVVTLGRGGSDTTAIALGAAFKARVEIFSDFDGIFAGDPRDDDYIKYDEIDYDSACKYAETGAKVLSKDSTEIALQGKVDVLCKSSNQLYEKGSHLTSVPTPFIGLSVKRNLCEIHLISNNCDVKLQKNIDFILKNVDFYKFTVKKDKIIILLDQKELKLVEHNLAEINNLLKK